MAEFLQTGGDPDWLLGLHRAPEKLRKLNEINKLLAHRPWLITKEHIQVQWVERQVPEAAQGPGWGMAACLRAGTEQVWPSFISRPC